MIISFLRAIIIYFVIIVGLRFMGKRQIGEMQPMELVITILISETASIPLEDTDSPLISALIPVTVLICIEIIISGINMKNSKFRKLFTGSPIILISNGTIDQKALKSVRLSMSDLLDNLRIQGVFNLSNVKYAILETNGQLSVMLADNENPVTPKILGIKADPSELSFTIISDGKLNTTHLSDVNITTKEIKNKLKKENLTQKEVMLMTADKNKNFYIVKRDKDI